MGRGKVLLPYTTKNSQYRARWYTGRWHRTISCLQATESKTSPGKPASACLLMIPWREGGVQGYVEVPSLLWMGFNCFSKLPNILKAKHSHPWASSCISININKCPSKCLPPCTSFHLKELWTGILVYIKSPRLRYSVGAMIFKPACLWGLFFLIDPRLNKSQVESIGIF